MTLLNPKYRDGSISELGSVGNPLSVPESLRYFVSNLLLYNTIILLSLKLNGTFKSKNRDGSISGLVSELGSVGNPISVPESPRYFFLKSAAKFYYTFFKVQLFWEGHKNLLESSSRFWHYLVKFIYSEKAAKFCEIIPLLLTILHTVKTRKILWPFQNIWTLTPKPWQFCQIFMAFSEKLIFIILIATFESKRRDGSISAPLSVTGSLGNSISLPVSPRYFV